MCILSVPCTFLLHLRLGTMHTVCCLFYCRAFCLRRLCPTALSFGPRMSCQRYCEGFSSRTLPGFALASSFRAFRLMITTCSSPDTAAEINCFFQTSPTFVLIFAHFPSRDLTFVAPMGHTFLYNACVYFPPTTAKDPPPVLPHCSTAHALHFMSSGSTAH